MIDGTSLIPLLAQASTGSSNAALITFVIYTLGVFALAWFSNKLLQSRSFMSEYFLGSRSLGVWAFALTFAATSASGGSFTGFPSKIYTHGWVLALWIGSYMVMPICAMGFLGKRINQVARISGSITVPDVLRDRFHSAAFGILSTLLIVFFMTFMLVAQFKAGSLILGTLLEDVTLFKTVVTKVGATTDGTWLLDSVEPAYLICLFTFGVAVIVYTTYGGFHAVVWTDVMQGVVMGVGVMIMLPLTLSQVGGLRNATEELAKMTPPRLGSITLTIPAARSEDLQIPLKTWLTLPTENGEQPRLFLVGETAIIKSGQTSAENVEAVEITTPEEIDRQLQKMETGGLNDVVTVENIEVKDYQFGAGRRGVYVSAPGPDQSRGLGFLPLSLSISFFFMWAISGSGQPLNMVRLMAFNNTTTLRRSIFTVTMYYSMIYFPLVIIFCCARILLPGMESEPDRIMPEMAIHITENIGMDWLAGLLVAAPFAAVMSTVDSALLMISSALVRDIYQRNIDPEVSEKVVKRLSYACTFVVGTGAMLGALNPPRFLQDIIVYTGSGLAACFLAPMVYTLYWPRANAVGMIAAMLGGFFTHLSMYAAGLFMYEAFQPFRPFDFDPIVLGLFVSFVTGYVVTRMTAPPPEELVRKYFYKST